MSLSLLFKPKVQGFVPPDPTNWEPVVCDDLTLVAVCDPFTFDPQLDGAAFQPE